jgi:hypothetical protein
MILKPLEELVGARGFEPPTPSLPDAGEALFSLANFWKLPQIIGIDSKREFISFVNQNVAPLPSHGEAA